MVTTEKLQEFNHGQRSGLQESERQIKIQDGGCLSEPCLISRGYIPSGKLLHSYGKSPFLMGKSTINGHFQ